MEWFISIWLLLVTLVDCHFVEILFKLNNFALRLVCVYRSLNNLSLLVSALSVWLCALGYFSIVFKLCLYFSNSRGNACTTQLPVGLYNASSTLLLWLCVLDVLTSCRILLPKIALFCNVTMRRSVAYDLIWTLSWNHFVYFLLFILVYWLVQETLWKQDFWRLRLRTLGDVALVAPCRSEVRVLVRNTTVVGVFVGAVVSNVYTLTRYRSHVGDCSLKVYRGLVIETSVQVICRGLFSWCELRCRILQVFLACLNTHFTTVLVNSLILVHLSLLKLLLLYLSILLWSIVAQILLFV